MALFNNELAPEQNRTLKVFMNKYDADSRLGNVSKLIFNSFN